MNSKVPCHSKDITTITRLVSRYFRTNHAAGNPRVAILILQTSLFTTFAMNPINHDSVSDVNKDTKCVYYGNLNYYIKCNLLFLTVYRVLFLISCIMKQSELFPNHRMNCCLYQAPLWNSSVQATRMLFIKQPSPDYKVANYLFL